MIEVGNRQVLLKAFRRLFTVPNIIEDVTLSSIKSRATPTLTVPQKNVWPPETLLSLLFNLGQQSSSSEAAMMVVPSTVVQGYQVTFKRVVEALDVCFEIARSEPDLFPPDVSRMTNEKFCSPLSCCGFGPICSFWFFLHFSVINSSRLEGSRS